MLLSSTTGTAIWSSPNTTASSLAVAPLFDNFQTVSRWTTTATNGSGLGQGDPTTLRWSFADEGTLIPASGNGDFSAGSDLIAFLDSVRGVGPGGADLTQRPWFNIFADSFARMSAVTGLTYVYEPNDDGVEFSSSGTTNPGVINVRGDIRIGGKFIDGEIGSNILAYNYYPEFGGDMVIDTGNPSFFGDTANNSVGLRNVIMHEHGHGLGLNHVESSSSQFLMEPFINLNFDGPQLDDILALQRLYGDALEKSGGNNSSTAFNLGQINPGAIIQKGILGDSTVVAATGTDFLSIDDESDVDYFKFTITGRTSLTVGLTPRGTTYQQGPQGGSQSAFNSKAQSNLALDVIGTDGDDLQY